MFDYSLLFQVMEAVPGAAKRLVVIGGVFATVEALKLAPRLGPYVKGWWSLGTNAVLTTIAMLFTINPPQRTVLNLVLLSIISTLASAGVHGTVARLSTPSQARARPGWPRRWKATREL